MTSPENPSSVSPGTAAETTATATDGISTDTAASVAAPSTDTAAHVTGPGTGIDGVIPGVPEHAPHTPEQQAVANKVEDCLYDVVDPELGINVVDLGLVYDIWVQGEDASAVTIYMTLTSPACPLTDMLEDQATSAVLGSEVVREMAIEWVWTPPWGPHMITEEGREQLRALGFSV